MRELSGEGRQWGPPVRALGTLRTHARTALPGESGSWGRLCHGINEGGFRPQRTQDAKCSGTHCAPGWRDRRGRGAPAPEARGTPAAARSGETQSETEGGRDTGFSRVLPLGTHQNMRSPRPGGWRRGSCGAWDAACEPSSAGVPSTPCGSQRLRGKVSGGRRWPGPASGERPADGQSREHPDVPGVVRGAVAGASQLVPRGSTSPIRPPISYWQGLRGQDVNTRARPAASSPPQGRALTWVLGGAQAPGPFVVLPAAAEAGLSASWTRRRPSSVLLPEQEVSRRLLAGSLRSPLRNIT